MTHPSHQTNGASLEDCHTNFFALVSDRHRLFPRDASRSRRDRPRGSSAGELRTPTLTSNPRRERSGTIAQGNGPTTSPLSRRVAGIVARDTSRTSRHDDASDGDHPLDVAPNVNLYSRPVLAIVDVDDVVVVVGRAAVVYCQTTLLPPLSLSLSFSCPRACACVSEIRSLLCRSQCHA